MSRRIELKKRLLGGYSVSYDCPACSARLVSQANDVGKNDVCPECGATFVVPGSDELKHLKEKEEKAIADRQQEIAEEKRRAAMREYLRQRSKDRINEESEQRGNESHNQLSEETREKWERWERERKTTGSSTRKCPYCAEDIAAAAIKCKHCGEFLTQDARKGPASVQQMDGCGLIICIAFGIVCAVLILAFL